MALVTLALNKSYEPLNLIPWQRAITLVFLEKAEILEEYESEVRSPRTVIKIPAVIRITSSYHLRPRWEVKFSKWNVFLRDGFVCQYCHEKFHEKELTFDHVVPVVQGGKRTWDNIATACKPCNARKEGRTPEQARMKLLKRPKKPVWSYMVPMISGRHGMPEQWKNYVFNS